MHFILQIQSINVNKNFNNHLLSSGFLFLEGGKKKKWELM